VFGVIINFIAHAYAARERYNNACLLVFLLPFSTKYLSPRQFRLCCIGIAVIRERIVSNTVAIHFFREGMLDWT